MDKRYACMVVALALSLPSTGFALDIVLDNFEDSLQIIEFNAFERAAQVWEGLLADPIQVRIEVGKRVLDGSALGTSVPSLGEYDYETVAAQLGADAGFGTNNPASDELLSLAFIGVPAAALNVQTINGPRTDRKMTLTSANAKAIGLTPTTSPKYNWFDAPDDVPSNHWKKPDAQLFIDAEEITNYDLNPDNGITPGLTDIVGVMVHEIGHVLGFQSITDVQDNNNTQDLYPMTLDIWRFARTGATHSGLFNPGEAKLITAGPAEYYDGQQNNVPLAPGSMIGDQAGHWDTSTGYRMDPDIAPGELGVLFEEDLHAMDYIGYDRAVLTKRVVAAADWKLGFFNLPDPIPGPGSGTPGFGGEFDGFAPPPDIDDVVAPFTPDFAVRVGLNLGEGLVDRGGVGFMRFAPERTSTEGRIVGVDADAGEFQHFLDTIPQRNLPDAITDFYFESDVAGIPFVGWSPLGVNGAPFDPSLGDHGGYLLTVNLDGAGDGVAGDIDAVVMLMLLADANGVPDPGSLDVFRLLPDPQNVMRVYDLAALGVPEPTTVVVMALLAMALRARRRRRYRSCSSAMARPCSPAVE